MRRTMLVIVASMCSWPVLAVPLLPDFSAATFDPDKPIDNAYFPMTASGTRVYVGSEDGEPIEVRFELTNLGPGPVIAGVQTYVQRS